MDRAWSRRTQWLLDSHCSAFRLYVGLDAVRGGCRVCLLPVAASPLFLPCTPEPDVLYTQCLTTARPRKRSSRPILGSCKHQHHVAHLPCNPLTTGSSLDCLENTALLRRAVSLCRYRLQPLDAHQHDYPAALLWFDFTLTFPAEVRRIWGSKFSSVTLVYLCTRYAAIVDRVLVVVEILNRDPSSQVSKSSDTLLSCILSC